MLIRYVRSIWLPMSCFPMKKKENPAICLSPIRISACDSLLFYLKSYVASCLEVVGGARKKKGQVLGLEGGTKVKHTHS